MLLLSWISFSSPPQFPPWHPRAGTAFNSAPEFLLWYVAVLVIYCYVTNCSETQCVKTTHIIIQRFLELGIQTWLSWDFCFRISQRLQSSFSWGRPRSQPTRWFWQCLTGCRVEGLSPSLAAGHRLPSVPWQMSLSKKAVFIIKASEGESAGKNKVTALGNLITKVTFHHGCHILWVAGKSRVVNYTKCEYSEVGLTGVHFRNLPITTA